MGAGVAGGLGGEEGGWGTASETGYLRGRPLFRFGISSSARGYLRGRPLFLFGGTRSSLAFADNSTLGPSSVLRFFIGRSSTEAARLRSTIGTLFCGGRREELASTSSRAKAAAAWLGRRAGHG